MTEHRQVDMWNRNLKAQRQCSWCNSQLHPFQGKWCPTLHQGKELEEDGWWEVWEVPGTLWNVENANCSLTVFAHARQLWRLLPSNRAEINNSLTTRQPRIFGRYPRAQVKVAEASICSGLASLTGPACPSGCPPSFAMESRRFPYLLSLAAKFPSGWTSSSQEAACTQQTP